MKGKGSRGLEFIPLPKGKTEEFYVLRRSRRHAGQLDIFGKAEGVRPDGKKRG